MKKVRVWVLAIVVFVFVFVVVSCRLQYDGDSNELLAKEEYSILQYYEYEYRDKENSMRPIVVGKALNTRFGVIGLPVAGSIKGYVWFIGNSSSNLIAQLPAEANFYVDETILKVISEIPWMSNSLKKYLSDSLSDS